MGLYDLIKPLVFKTDPEFAHKAALRAIKMGAFSCLKKSEAANLTQDLFGLNFKNPIGIAAGFDKDAEIFNQLLDMGFGFVELGTVTPKSQIGNPKPRVFRDVKTSSIINALGFPSKGMASFKRKVKHYNGDGIVGINIGKNKQTEDAAQDYCLLVKELGKYASYITVNISSPNTPGLRELQTKEHLNKLLKKVLKSREDLDNNPAILVKIAPDLSDADLKDIVDISLELKIDGLIVSNTTIERPEILNDNFAKNTGGLSGKLLNDKSNKMIGDVYKLTKGKIPIIGVGGISSGADAYDKICAGANLVQLYTGFVFNGFGLLPEMNKYISDRLVKDGFYNIIDAVGSKFNSGK